MSPFVVIGLTPRFLLASMPLWVKYQKRSRSSLVDHPICCPENASLRSACARILRSLPQVFNTRRRNTRRRAAVVEPLQTPAHTYSFCTCGTSSPPHGPPNSLVFPPFAHSAHRRSSLVPSMCCFFQAGRHSHGLVHIVRIITGRQHRGNCRAHHSAKTLSTFLVNHHGGGSTGHHFRYCGEY